MLTPRADVEAVERVVRSGHGCGFASHADWLLPLGLAVAAVLEILLVHPDYDRRIFLPLALLLPLSLTQRRSFPLAVLALNIAAWVVIDTQSPINEDPLALAICLAIATYSAAAHTSGRRALAGAVLVVTIALAGTIADANEGTLLDFLGNAIFFFTIFGGLWLAGRAMRRRRVRERELIVERDEGARAAVAEERARIARELHDVVAHAISVIVLQARGARHADPAEREEALDGDRVDGRRDALAEMRRLLHMLRADDEAVALAPQPSLEQLEHLVAQVRDAGLPVELRVVGERRELPPGVDVSAYRIVQEALTNALKHAGPARAQCVDPLRAPTRSSSRSRTPAPAPSNGAGGGHGLVGMRERVAVFGGELDSGPRRGRRLRRPSEAAAVIRVVLADDQQLVRSGFRMILRADPELEVVGEAADGVEAVSLAPGAAPGRRADGRADAARGRDRGDPADLRLRPKPHASSS